VGHRLNIGKIEYFRAMVLDISVPEFQLGIREIFEHSYRADTMILRLTSNLKQLIDGGRMMSKVVTVHNHTGEVLLCTRYDTAPNKSRGGRQRARRRARQPTRRRAHARHLRSDAQSALP
jgi:hypothetical protein